MMNAIEKRTVGDVIRELESMNAATAEISGRNADGTPVFAVIFVRGEESTKDVLELLEAYQDENTPRLNELDAAVNEAAEELVDTSRSFAAFAPQSARAAALGKLATAVVERRAWHELLNSKKALELVKTDEA